MELNDSLDEFAPVAQVFEEMNIAYQLGGSVASSVHGFPRGTQDIDVEADLRDEHVAEFVRRLENRYIVTADMVQEALRTRHAFNLIPFDALVKIDIFPIGNRAFDREAASRRENNVAMEDGSLFPYYVGSAEDTILRKLEWYRMGGEVSEQKWKDVLGVLKAQQFDLDFAYLKKWSSELKVSDLLERALDQSGLKV